jgi:hypothetical protein
MADQSADRRDPTEPLRPRRPILLTLIFWVFVLWTVLGWLRLFGAITRRMLILEFFPSWVFGYLVLAGLIWGLVGLPVIWGLAFRAGWARRLLPIAALIYPLLYWLERIILWQAPEGRGNEPFMLLLTGFWLGLVVWVMRSGKVRRFFDQAKHRNK